MVADTILVVAVGILALLGFVVYRAKPAYFKLSAGIWKVITLNVELHSATSAEPAKPTPDEEQQALPDGEHRAIPPSDEPRALPVGSDGEPTGPPSA
jgi:hypothetical protein